MVSKQRWLVVLLRPGSGFPEAGFKAVMFTAPTMAMLGTGLKHSGLSYAS